MFVECKVTWPSSSSSHASTDTFHPYMFNLSSPRLVMLYIYVTSLTVIFGGLFASPTCEKLLLHSLNQILIFHNEAMFTVTCVCVCVIKYKKIHPILDHRNINYNRRINPSSIFTAIFVIHLHFIQQKHRTPTYFLRSAAKKEFNPFQHLDLFFEVTKYNF
jgi:predicted nucleotidyltransferase